MNDEASMARLHFSADFAARVVAKADAILRRRRRVAVAMSSFGALAILAASLWSIQVSRAPTAQPAPSGVQIVGARQFTWPESGQPDPMQWMFPDAQPVAQFASTYSESMMGGARQRQRLLLADDSDPGESL